MAVVANAGFVQQLLAFEDSLKLAQQGERTTDEYKEQVLRKIGITLLGLRTSTICGLDLASKA